MSKIGKLTLLLFVLCFLVTSCDFWNFIQPQNGKGGGKIVAKVYDKELYESEILNLTLLTQKKADSTARIRQYINSWLKQNALIYHAEEQLSTDELSKIDLQVEDYRKSLIMYSYERALISEKVDTSLNSKEIFDYYQRNKENFKSNNNILKARYIVLPNTISDLEKLINAFEELDEDSSNIDVLQDVAFKYKALHSFGAEWYEYEDFKNHLKIPTKRSAQKFLTNNSKLSYTDSLFTYLVKIDKFALSGDYMPFEYCKNDIKALLLNKRQKDFIQQTKENMYQDAVNNNKVEIKE